MYCGKCGSELKIGDKFCGKCGQAVSSNSKIVTFAKEQKKRISLLGDSSNSQKNK